MHEWMEPISKEKESSAKQFLVIPLRWTATTVPEVPVTLSIDVQMRLTPDGIQVHAHQDEDPEWGSSAQDFHFQFGRGTS